MKPVTLTNIGETTLHIQGISGERRFCAEQQLWQYAACRRKMYDQCDLQANRLRRPYWIALAIADDASGSPQQITFERNRSGLSCLAASPATATVNSGTSAVYTINVKALGGTFGSAVSLSCAGLPSASGCSFTRVSVVPGATSVNSAMTVATRKRIGSTGTPAGTYTVTVKGTSGSTLRSTTVKLTVN